MMIDAYSHTMPYSYCRALLNLGITDHKNIPRYLADMNDRRALLADFPGTKNISIPMQLPFQHRLPDEAMEDLARIYNDALAELEAQFPDMIAASVAAVPIHSVESAMREAERAITRLSLKGILLPCDFFGNEPSSPEFRPLLDMMAELDLPIWLHPCPVISSRKPVTGSGGWEMLSDTADAMLHLACSGVFEEHPDLKIIAHHGGSFVPQFHTRLKSQYFCDMFETTSKYDPSYVEPDRTLTDMYYENLKKFYVDTAYYGNCPSAIRLCLDYFGADHVLFGTDFPLPTEAELAPNIETIRALGLPSDEEENIFHGNIERLLHLE